MKLSEHVETIRLLIDRSFRNRLGRIGITNTQLQPIENIPQEYVPDREKIEPILEVFIGETGSEAEAYEKLVEELTFTLFNRLSALKVMEAHIFFPEIITRREVHGERSFAHLAWLEENPEAREEEAEGLIRFLEYQFDLLSENIPLFSLNHPYHLLPTAIELNNIIKAFNAVENDEQVEPDCWKSDDILGWLYESYNNYKKIAHKTKGDKTEYNKVSIQSQVYTPRWVVKFLVDNSLGKLYLEMFPDSTIKEKYKIANPPTAQIRKRKPITQIRLIDPATGSGNFMLYAFDLFYDIYLDQIENYGADYDENKIAQLIIENNLYGIDLDNRAIQIAQLGLYIKAKRKQRRIHITHFNVVSSDFYLPEYEQVHHIFEENAGLDPKQKEIIRDIWSDLRQAYKFGSLVKLDEKLSIQLHGLQQQFEGRQFSIFGESMLANYEQFRDNFFINLQRAVEKYTDRQVHTFIKTKTQDAITFLQMLTQKYDVAVANPPYTDSADFGVELKAFINAHYSKPYKFNTNLYATFIKRCCELTEEDGKLALIHPLTFMYIKSFEDVRKYIIENLHINIFVDYGLSNLFGTIMVDPAFYVLEKKKNEKPSLFISLNQYTRTPNEKFKKDFCLEALDDYIANRPNKHNITLPQSKLKIIDGWPFIYWISDGFREKFKGEKLDNVLFIRQGGATGDNLRMLRYWWEVSSDRLSKKYGDNKKWVIFQKGGPYSKWYGNNWCIIGYNDPIEYKFLKNSGNSLPSEDKYFLEGITYCSSGSKGISFRYMPENQIISGAGPGLFPNIYKNINFILGFLNSKLSFYIADCLNPTVNTTQGDLKRIPFIKPNSFLENLISILSKNNVEIKKQLCSFSLIETNFNKNPLSVFSDATLTERVQSYLNYENTQLAIVLLNEAIIDELIYQVYELSPEDRKQVEAKMGISVGSLGVTKEAQAYFLSELDKEEIAAEVKELLVGHITSLDIVTYSEERKQEIVAQFVTLYQSNNNLEEFCIRNQINPMDVCLWFRQANILPAARAAEIALEFLADAIRTLLMDDEDGIIPLVGLPGDPRLIDRLEQHCLNQGFTLAQFMQLERLLGRPLNEYIEQYFFRDFSNRLNLFMYLPKTPFIWHLSSGVHQGFEAYIIIYKWDRDSLFKLKSYYIRHRVENLEYRLIQLQGVETAQAQNEKETIGQQLREIEIFTTKIDELIAEGYDPKLDDGVGKNIAPLQKKGLLKAEVLKPNQLEKYLNADW